MRKLLLFVMSVAMLVGGLYLLAAAELFATHWYGWLSLMGFMLVMLGTYLLCTDFIAASLTRNDEQ